MNHDKKSNLIKIDELARKTKTTSRTIRYYTHEELLHPPVMKGRTGYYTNEHIERINLIKQLQKKSYLPLSLIKEIVDHPEKAEKLEEQFEVQNKIFKVLGYKSKTKFYGISEVSKKTSLSQQKIKNLEEAGFVYPIKESGIKKYSDEDIKIIMLIKEILESGFSIEEFKFLQTHLLKLAKEEVKTFHNKFYDKIETNPDLVIHLTENLLKTTVQLVSLLHQKLLKEEAKTHILSECKNDNLEGE
jgi:DNA-binding transcriptional MerR regulator